MPNLDDPRARVIVARKHIDALRQQAEGLCGKNAHGVVAHKDDKTGQTVLRAANVPDIPKDFSIMVGMIAHNLRAALDGLACQLALLNAGCDCAETVCDDTMFPIRINGPRSKVRSKKPNERRMSPKSGRTKGLHGFKARIEAVQPYKRGSGHRKNLLWLLDRLNNADKHRVLVVMATKVGGSLVTFQRKQEGVGDCSIYAQGIRINLGRVAKDGTKVGMISSAIPHMNVHGHLTLEIVFGKGCVAVEGRNVISTIQEICDHVHNIVESFALDFL